MICFIPTKGRYNTKTYKLFQEVGIQFKHFVEPDELHLYQVPNKISILEKLSAILLKIITLKLKSLRFEIILFFEKRIKQLLI